MAVRLFDGADPRAIASAVIGALDHTGPVLGLGLHTPPHATLAPDVAALIATSGSTGVPKTVVLSARALRASACATAERIGEGSWLLALPAAYVAGLQVLVRAALAATRTTYLDGRFTVSSFARAVDDMPRGARYTSLVPAQLSALLDAAEHDVRVRGALRSFESILVGGQAMPRALRERAAAAGARVVGTYGSSETSGGCVYDGVPLEGVTVRTVADELQIAGEVLAEGYLDDPATTEAAFTSDSRGVRWYRTGDAATVDRGVVSVTGRLDNVIVSGGVNVSLDRVEAVIRGVPGLEGAVVIGVPDERWGEGCVVVAPHGGVMRDDGRGDGALLEAARARVAGEIGRAARPARIVHAPVPSLASGKPDREALRREFGRLLDTRPPAPPAKPGSDSA